MQGGADLLDKKMVSSRQTATKEDETVDKDCPLDLNPNSVSEQITNVFESHTYYIKGIVTLEFAKLQISYFGW